MSGYPPPGPGGFGQPGFIPGQAQQQYSIGAVTRTSGAAITSLIFGLVGFCVPVIGGLVAILTGLIGIKSTGNPAVKGRAMAIIGLLLGILSLGLYSSIGLWAYKFVHWSGPEHSFAVKYINELSTGDTLNATSDTADDWASHVPANITTMSSWGTVTKDSFVVINLNDAHLATGTITFSNGQVHSFQMAIKSDHSGALKIEMFQLTN